LMIDDSKIYSILNSKHTFSSVKNKDEYRGNFNSILMLRD